MFYVFAHRKDDDEIFPLTVEEIATAQKKDKTIQRDKQAYVRKLVENTHVLCKDGRLVIPRKLQYRAIAWYHHYLQHPGHTRLEETLKQAMYVGTIRTIPPSSQSLAIDDLKRRYCCSPRE